MMIFKPNLEQYYRKRQILILKIAKFMINKQRPKYQQSIDYSKPSENSSSLGVITFLLKYKDLLKLKLVYITI